MTQKNSHLKSVWRSIGLLIKIVILTIIVFFVVNIVYLLFSYKRIPDWTYLETQTAKNKIAESNQPVQIGQNYKAISYNTGFSAYLQDFTFFMDGGKESWAKSTNSVINTTVDIANVISDQNADFVSLQEVDSDSTRTYNIDETSIIYKRLREYSNVVACCFDSPFLFWPIYQPHGQSKSNLMTLSKFTPNSDSVRRQFPVDNSFTKILDYDRCYSKTKYTTSNGHELVWYSTHMSAYSQDPTTSNNQISQIVEDMQEEYNKGNYCVCGADFNKQIVDNPDKYFEKNKIYSVKPFPYELLLGSNVSVVSPFNENNPVGTCRDAGQVYGPEDPICNIDGFLVTANVEIQKADVVNTDFAYSDHNPVYMIFSLK